MHEIEPGLARHVPNARAGGLAGAAAGRPRPERKHEARGRAAGEARRTMLAGDVTTRPAPSRAPAARADTRRRELATIRIGEPRTRSGARRERTRHGRGRRHVTANGSGGAWRRASAVCLVFAGARSRRAAASPGAAGEQPAAARAGGRGGGVVLASGRPRAGAGRSFFVLVGLGMALWALGQGCGRSARCAQLIPAADRGSRTSCS